MKMNKLVLVILFILLLFISFCDDIRELDAYSYVRYVNLVPNSLPMDVYFGIDDYNASSNSRYVEFNNIAYGYGTDINGAATSPETMAYKKIAPAKYTDIFALLYTTNKVPDLYNVFGWLTEYDFKENQYYILYCAGMVFPMSDSSQEPTTLYVQHYNPAAGITDGKIAIRAINFCADCGNIDIVDLTDDSKLFENIPYGLTDNEIIKYVDISNITSISEKYSIRKSGDTNDLYKFPKDINTVQFMNMGDYGILVSGLSEVKLNPNETYPGNFSSEYQYLSAGTKAFIIRFDQ